MHPNDHMSIAVVYLCKVKLYKSIFLHHKESVKWVEIIIKERRKKQTPVPQEFTSSKFEQVTY